MEVPPRQRLSAADWTAAALDALAAGGVAAVSVEPIAARLGTTKGSFYWHFSGRDALLEAALQLWERTDTADVIAWLDAEPDLRRRLHSLLRLSITASGSTRVGGVELALQASADHPLVAPVLARVTRQRLDYLTALFAELGFAPAAARRRALLAYTAYLGHAQLAHATADQAPHGPELSGYIDDVIATLTSG
jgi:AcrR family transcriptional regulator